MTAHLSPETVAAYRARRLPPDDFLAADRHLASCDACAAAVSVAPVEASLTSLAQDLARASGDAHLSYEQLESLVDDTAGEIDREIADAHLDACETCAAALADLERFRHELAPSSRAGAASRSAREGRWRRYAVPAAAAAVVTFALVIPRLTRGPGSPPPSPGAQPLESPPATVTPAVRPDPGVPATQGSTPAGATGAQTSPAGLDEPRRSAVREIAGKRFRFVAGEWIDEGYDRGARLPEVRITNTADRAALEAKVPALAPFSALGRRVTVVVEGTVYVFAVAE